MNNNMLKKTKLLIISDRYPHEKDTISSSFVKSQVDILKKYFEKIYVISLTPFVPKYLSKFPFMNPRWQRDAFASNYKYDNVEVYFAKHITFPFNFSRQKRGDIAVKVVNKIINEYNINFDLMHAHFTYPSGYVAAKLKEIHEKKFILTIHENDECFSNEILSKDRKLVYTWQSADKIVRVNLIDLKKFDNLEIDKSKLLSIPNGFSSDMFKPENILTARKKLNLPTDKRILVNIANLEEYKGQKYLIRSMKKVFVARKDAMLYIVGDGSLRNRLQSMIQEYGLQKNVVLAGGNKPREEIPIWMQACDVFVLPSISEGNPTVMFEALGCGKPFVGTRVGGIPEIIINEKLGILVEPEDIDGLAKAILRAAETDWDMEYIQGYAEQFTWDKIAMKTLKLYDELIKKR